MAYTRVPWLIAGTVYVKVHSLVVMLWWHYWALLGNNQKNVGGAARCLGMHVVADEKSDIESLSKRKRKHRYDVKAPQPALVPPPPTTTRKRNRRMRFDLEVVRGDHSSALLIIRL